MLLDALKRNPKLAAGLAAATVGVIAMQSVLDRPDMRRQPGIEPVTRDKAISGTFGGAGLPFEYSLAALSGFRQVIAGLLWVRADSFFHSGNYDAILPMIRLITWLDPNWIDVYATGAWHLMYNFTDTDQRSDRRYLPVGLALLDEGIANNPNIFDVYKEKGWNNYDKVKDYPGAIEAYSGGAKADPNADINQIYHPLAHSYERNGQPDEAIQWWQTSADKHEALMKAAGENQEVKFRNEMGYRNSLKNQSLLRVRAKVRPENIQRLGQIDTGFDFTVVRKSSKVLQISGTMNIHGTIKDAFDAGTFDPTGVRIQQIGAGILRAGPVDGARVDIRLHDEGYTMPKLGGFSFEVDPSTTIMQDSIVSKGGRMVQAGGAYAVDPRSVTPEPVVEAANIYPYKPKDAEALKGVPAAEALKGAAPISAYGQWQLVSLAYPKPMNSALKCYLPAEVPALFARLKADPETIDSRLTKKNIYIARGADQRPGKFSREFDMSKDPKMYGFKKDSYDLILSFNPRLAADMIQDRIGWNGEGITDKRYLDTTTKPGLRMLRAVIKLKREDILGEGEKVLWPPQK